MRMEITYPTTFPRRGARNRAPLCVEKSNRGAIGDMSKKTGGGNPRYANGNLRRKHRARFKAMQAPCGICGGKYGEIHYDEPSDAKHPLSFVIDEIHPVSRWKEFGYPSPRHAAQDWNNLQAAHYMCNAAKSNKIAGENRSKTKNHLFVSDGEW